MNSHATDAAPSAIPFDWRIVKLDDTRYFDETWHKSVGLKSCATYYVYDANRHVHLCEWTPSLELHAVAVDAEYTDYDATTDEAREEVDEVLRSAMYDQEVTYVHVDDLGKAPQQHIKDDTKREDGEDDEHFYLRIVEGLREYYQGNCPYF